MICSVTALFYGNNGDVITVNIKTPAGKFLPDEFILHRLVSRSLQQEVGRSRGEAASHWHDR